MVTDEIIELLGGRDGPIFAPPIEDFLDDLAHGPEVPDRAVAACVIRIDEAAPALLQLLARAADGADLDEAETLQLHRGLHILGGARIEAAWPLLLRFLALPGDEIDRYIGDTVTETLSRIAIGVYDGDADSLFAFVLDASHDEFVRKALIAAATFLTWDDRIETPRMEAFLQRFWDDPAADFDFAWVGWLDAIALLGLERLVPLAHRAFREGRVDTLLYNRTNFDGEMARTKASPDDDERFSENDLGYIEDVLEAIQAIPTDDDGWADDLPDTPDHRLTPSFAGPAEPIRNPWRNVGRNDPCPCGSGKKAKKCCLANQGQPPGFDPG